MKKARKKKGPDADNISRRQRAFRQGRRAEVYARWVLRAKGYRVLARNFRHPLGEVDLIMRRGRLLILLRSSFAPIVIPALMQCRLPSGGASARVLPDLSRAIHIMRALSGGLTCLLSAAMGVSGTIKISGALEPARNFGESVGREARGARRVLVERDAYGLTRRSANGSDC